MRIQLYKEHERLPEELNKDKVNERFKQMGSCYHVGGMSFDCNLKVLKCRNCGTELYAVWEPCGIWYFSDNRPATSLTPANIKIQEDKIIADTKRKVAAWDKKCKEEDLDFTEQGVVCPVCGKHISEWHFRCFSPSSRDCDEEYHISQAFYELESSREKRLELLARDKLSRFIKSTNSSASYPEASGDTHKNSAGFDLKKYILDLIHLETGILSLQKHLNDLYQMQFKNEDEVCIIDHAPLIDV